MIVDYRDEEDLIRVMIALGIVVYKMIFKSYPELPIMDRSIQCWYIFSKFVFFSLFLIKMPTRFYYEDGQGRIVDEQGNGVDWDKDVAPFQFKTLICIKQYCDMQGNEQTRAKED